MQLSSYTRISSGRPAATTRRSGVARASAQQQPQQPHQAPGGGRRAALLGLGALAALTAAPSSRAAGAAAPAQPGALEEYMQAEAKGKLKDRRQLDDVRCGCAGPSNALAFARLAP